MTFIYREVFDGDALQHCGGYEDCAPDVIDAILVECGKMAAEILLPLRRAGDQQGCTLENGGVRAPPGFKAGYDAFVSGGWAGVNAPVAYGGQGLPYSVNVLIDEMVCATNMALGGFTGLTHGANAALSHYGTDAQKQLYLPKFASGAWVGTMCLTEPQCGTDLGLIKTFAAPAAEGAYAVTGAKIFISAGDHDLTENIVHLVLARLPDAPAGISGLSLFIVPKFIPNAAGEVGARNAVVCTAVEHKMGVHGLPTCSLSFDGATGWLVGERHKGMRAMFAMMNTARLLVGVQALGIAEAAYQNAVRYAKERLQGRSARGPQHPALPADPIIVHPDVRKNLLTMKAMTEGLRALVMWTAYHQDMAEKATDAATRQSHDDLVQLLTPIVKAFGTDASFGIANLGVQVYGGHGYIRDNGMEQLVRDVRITQIYEGTNGVQALDLIARKIPANDGRGIIALLRDMDLFIGNHRADSRLVAYLSGFAVGYSRLHTVLQALRRRDIFDPTDLGAIATDVLSLFGYVCLGFMWVKIAKAALRKSDDDASGFYAAKLRTAKFFFTKLMPQTEALTTTILAQNESITDLDDTVFRFTD